MVQGQDHYLYIFHRWFGCGMLGGQCRKLAIWLRGVCAFQVVSSTATAVCSSSCNLWSCPWPVTLCQLHSSPNYHHQLSPFYRMFLHATKSLTCCWKKLQLLFIIGGSRTYLGCAWCRTQLPQLDNNHTTKPHPTSAHIPSINPHVSLILINLWEKGFHRHDKEIIFKKHNNSA